MNSDEQWQWTTDGLIRHAERTFPEHIALLATGRPPLSYAGLVHCAAVWARKCGNTASPRRLVSPWHSREGLR